MKRQSVQKSKRSERGRIFTEDLDVEVEDPSDEEFVVHNRKKTRQVESLAVNPKEAHRFADEVDDFDAEEELAREVSRKSHKRVSEDDFALGAVAAAKPRAMSGGARTDLSRGIETVERNFAVLSSEDRVAFLRREAPELLTMLDEVRRYLAEVSETCQPLHDALHHLHTTPDQKDVMAFLETKVQLLLSYCMHVTYYLLLKTEGSQVKHHPVLDRLVELRVYLEKLWPLEDKLQYTMNKLLVAGRSGVPTAVNVKNLRPVAAAESKVYQPSSRGTAALDESKALRHARKVQRDADEQQKLEESTMTRLRGPAAAKAGVSRAADKQGPAATATAVDAYREDEDAYFSKFVVDDDSTRMEDAPLIERLRARMLPPKRSGLDDSTADAKTKKKRVRLTDDTSDQEEGDDFFSDNADSADYDALLEEEALREDAELERQQQRHASAGGQLQEKEVARRKIGSRIESHRGLTKARPKDRKTPRTAQRRKYERGMQKVKSQTKTVQPEPAEGFQGVRSLKANVTHSTRLQ